MRIGKITCFKAAPLSFEGVEAGTPGWLSAFPHPHPQCPCAFCRFPSAFSNLGLSQVHLSSDKPRTRPKSRSSPIAGPCQLHFSLSDTFSSPPHQGPRGTSDSTHALPGLWTVLPDRLAHLPRCSVVAASALFHKDTKIAPEPPKQSPPLPGSPGSTAVLSCAPQQSQKALSRWCHFLLRAICDLPSPRIRKISYHQLQPSEPPM
jgi:hypothetical protein